MFEFRFINRKTYPKKHVLIVEDDLINQVNVLGRFSTQFDSQGEVQFSCVSGSLYAAAIIHQFKPDLIILDHDLPHGNGSDLLNWMKEYNVKIPVITFSGIEANNLLMMEKGANFHFNKNDVIDGKAEALIKVLLEMNKGEAETYQNLICINQPFAKRYWVTPKIMVGGSIIDDNDWKHLQKDYNIDAVINIETEHSDRGRGFDIKNLCEIQTPDNGTPFSPDLVKGILKFGKEMLDQGKVLYVHCQMGGSRSPAAAYGLLRYWLKLNHTDALNLLNESFPSASSGIPYGNHHYHISYMNAIESVLKDI